jgi:hypothetical protein
MPLTEKLDLRAKVVFADREVTLMTETNQETEMHEPMRTALARAEAGASALNLQYANASIQIQHIPTGEIYYHYNVSIYGIDIPLGFGVEDVLELNSRGDLEWGLAFVQR